MKKINWNELLSYFAKYGNSERFQLLCVRELAPLTDMFIRIYNIQEEYHGEIKSYLWAGYFSSFESYNGTTQIQTWISVISRNRIKDFLRKIKKKPIVLPQLYDIAYTEEDEDNTYNELLVEKLLVEAGITGLDADVFKLKKGILGNKKLADSYICKVMGLRKKTLKRINNRNAKAIAKYKKENKE